MADEVWVAALGFDGTYSVSSLGNVRRNTAPAGKYLKPRAGGVDRLCVVLRDRGRRKKWYIHRLVFFSFAGAIESGMEVDHVNGDHTDNRLCNLEAVTRLENMRRSFAMGRNVAFGNRCARSVFSDTDVLSIRRRVAEGEKQNKIASEYGVTPTAINCIVKRLTWKHLP